MGAGFEGSAGVFAFFLAEGLLVTPSAVEGEDPVTGEGGRAADVDGGF